MTKEDIKAAAEKKYKNYSGAKVSYDLENMYNHAKSLQRSSFIAGAEWMQSNASVSVDTTPEVGEFVLVFNTEGAILTGRLMNNGWVASFLDGEHLVKELNILFWQPLPTPPTFEGKLTDKG